MLWREYNWNKIVLAGWPMAPFFNDAQVLFLLFFKEKGGISKSMAS